MTSYIINHHHGARNMQLITFTQEDMMGQHHLYCDALVVRVVVACNGLKRMLWMMGVLLASYLMPPMTRWWIMS